MADRKESISIFVKGADQGSRDLDKLGRAVDGVGDELKDTAKDASHLDKELDRLQRSAHDLNREFERTGDKGLLAQIKDVRKELAPLQAVRRELDRVAAAEAKVIREREAAAKKSEADRIKQMTTPVGLFGGSGGGVSLPVNSTTLAVGGAAGVGLSLPVLAGAGGAILAGGALAGVGLGVAGAAKGNPAIGQAAAAALQEEQARWIKASKAFEQPTLQAIKRLKMAAEDIPLEDILDNASKLVGPLTEGIAGLVEESGKGLGALVEDAGPVVATLQKQLPMLGTSVRKMFEEIGEGSEGGAAALEDIFEVVSRIIIGTGKLIHFFEDVYEAGVKLRKALPGDVWSDDTPKIIGYTGAIAGVTPTMRDAADATADATEELETYEETLHRLLNIPMELAEANAAYQESLDNLTESIKENGRQWDEGSEKGRKNNETVREAINKALAYRDAQVAAGKQTGDANRELEANIARLRQQAINAGMSAAAFDALTGSLRNYISQPSVKVVETRFVTSGSAPRMSTPGRQFAFAEGGNFAPGFALVGEEGPEIVKFNGSGRVYSNRESKAMARSVGASAGGGGGERRHVIDLRFNGRTIRELVIDGAADRGQSVAAFLGV